AVSQAMATHEVGALHHTPYTPVLTQAHRRPTLLVARAWSRPRPVRAPARGTFHRLTAVRLAARLKR
ncbi:MAG TPA: hypothetical protein VMB50_18630, partial [Myxococcales bacterium]|nr:hypothetical protein [Myxococcales bacterium]